MKDRNWTTVGAESIRLKILDLSRLSRISIVTFACLFLPSEKTRAADSLYEGFDGSTISSLLQNPGGYAFGPDSNPAGIAERTSDGDRAYISTVATDYNTVDFTFDLTMNIAPVSTTGGAYDDFGLIFMGMGSAHPDSSFFTQPDTSVAMRSWPGSEMTLEVSSAPGTRPSEPTVGPLSSSDTVEARISKVGDTITFAYETGYSGGAFTPTYSTSLSLSNQLSFLNSTNSRLFFGCDVPATVSSLSITVSPPTPTSAPPISVLPAADNHAVSDFAFVVLSQHASDFSTPSYNNLTTNVNLVAPLIEPNSSQNLKNNILNGLADGLEFAGTAVNVVKTGIDLKEGNILPDEAAFSLAMPFMADKSSLETFAFISLARDAFEELPLLETNPAAAAVAFGISVNTTIYADILAPELKQFAAGDPIDPNYSSVYIPELNDLSFLPTTGNAELDAALRQQSMDLQKMGIYLAAVNASFDKYSGAIQGGDNIHATLQMEALLNYLHLYDQAAQAAAADTHITSGFLESLGLAGGTYDPEQLIGLQADISSNGFSTNMLSLLSSLGLTSGEMNQVEQDLLDINATAYTGTLTDASATASSELLAGTTAAPEPDSISIVLSCLAYALGRRKCGLLCN